MTFNLEWADDPASGGITRSYDANVVFAFSDGVTKMGVMTHHEGPGFYNANNSLWWWLLDVMDELGMTSEDGSPGIPLVKLTSNSGAHVLPGEILDALCHYILSSEPSVTDFADEGDPEACRRTWDEWVDWLRTAAAHGGFRVN